MSLFKDTFTGTGSIANHIPDAKFGGFSWSANSPDVLLSGGYAVGSEGSYTGSPGRSSVYGDSMSGFSSTSTLLVFTATFMFRTPSVVDTDPVNDRTGMRLTLYCGGIDFFVGVTALATEGWTLNAYQYESVPVTLAASTEYTGTIHIEDGVQTIVFLGQTISTGYSFPNSGGLSQINLGLGTDFALNSIDVAAPVSTGVAAVYSPASSVSAFGGANAALNAPPIIATAVATSHTLGVVSPVLLVCPAASISAFGGGTASVTAPSPGISAQGHSSAGERSAELTCPRPTLSAYSGANATLSSSVPTLHITATVTNFGTAALHAPAGFVSAGGTVSGMATADLNAPVATLAGYSGAVCSLTLTGSPTVLASGTTGSVGGADIRGPSPRLVSSGMDQGYGSANLLAPAGHLGATARAWLTAPSPRLTATGHAVVAATYEAYAINLNHAPGNQEPVDEVTHYTNFPFNGIVRYQSSYYGWGADGLYLLEGTMDDENEIPYAVRTCIDDFKLTNEKNVVSAYFAGRIGPDMTVTLYAGEDGQASYNYHTANGSQARTHREKFARGVTDRYFAIGVSGKGALELADIELEINKLKRKT